MKRSLFAQLHPSLIFLYFVGVIVGCMSTLNPVYVTLSFCGALTLAIASAGLKRAATTLLAFIPAFLIIIAINVLVNQLGETTLTTIFSRRVTAEALIFSASSGLMLLAVILWFTSYQALMTSDKFLALFGRVLPALSLVMAMIFRFIDQFAQQGRQVRLAQRALLGDAEKGRVARSKASARLTSVLMGWTLEESIETADAMRARGYGSRQRTHFSPYVWGRKDTWWLIALIACIAINAWSIATAASRVMFYPYFTLTLPSFALILAYGAFLLLPFFVELGGMVAWLRYRFSA